MPESAGVTGESASRAGTARRGSIADRVAEVISGGIRSGVFIPGQHLPESDLTQRLRISRGSLREALKHLAAAGIVTLNRFRGAYISTLDRKSMLDLLETLEPLACLAARLAARNCDTGKKRDRMRQAAARIEQAIRGPSYPHYLEGRRLFYDTLVDIAGNKELARVIPLPRADLLRAQIEIMGTERQRVRHSMGYRKIAQAVIDQDAAAAERAVKRHFAGTRTMIAELSSRSSALSGLV